MQPYKFTIFDTDYEVRVYENKKETYLCVYCDGQPANYMTYSVPNRICREWSTELYEHQIRTLVEIAKNDMLPSDTNYVWTLDKMDREKLRTWCRRSKFIRTLCLHNRLIENRFDQTIKICLTAKQRDEAIKVMQDIARKTDEESQNLVSVK